MIKIKRIKLDKIEHSDYGIEHWCRVYSLYKGRFYKTWQLILANDELNSYQLAYELSKRTKEIKAHIKSISGTDKYRFVT